MKLYYSPGACSLSPHIALCEAGLPFELVRVDLKTKLTELGFPFEKINPKGYIPVLEIDNQVFITEGPVISQYIADLKPESKLAPAAGSLERIRLQEWLCFISSEIHKNYFPLFHAENEEWKNTAIARLTRRYAWVGTQLQGKKYLMGEQFTVADAYLFNVLRWCKTLKLDISPIPNLADFIERVQQRPAVQTALKEEGLS